MRSFTLLGVSPNLIHPSVGSSVIKETEKDLSVVVKFKIIDEKFLKKQNNSIYFLAWTTTPWSLMSTMGLAIDAKTDYAKILYKDEYYILAKSRISQIMAGLGEYKITDEFKGKNIETRKRKKY